MAATRLALSGQVPEAYALLRLTIEYALYGFYIEQNSGLAETWLRRHDNDVAKKKVRDEFQIKKLFEALRNASEKLLAVTFALYDRCIDYGAHPNEKALSQSLKKEKSATTTTFQVAYAIEDTPALRLVLQSAAQVSVAALKIFKLIFTERFDILGLTARINRLSADL